MKKVKGQIVQFCDYTAGAN